MAEKKMTLQEWMQDLNNDPNPDHVKKNDDDSEFIPISIEQKLLDETFLSMWDFEVLRETYGKTSARGYGRMIGTCPVNGKQIVRGGDAAINLTGDLKLDSPRLEAMILLSCAKKFGRKFGRDLNRDKQDAPLPVIQIVAEAKEVDQEFENVKLNLQGIEDKDKAATYLKSTSFKYHLELNSIVNSKI